MPGLKQLVYDAQEAATDGQDEISYGTNTNKQGNFEVTLAHFGYTELDLSWTPSHPRREIW